MSNEMDLIDDGTLRGESISMCSSSLLTTSDNSPKNDSIDKVCIIILFISGMNYLLILLKLT